MGTIAPEGENAPARKAALAIAPDDMTVSPAYIDKLAETAVRMPVSVEMLVVIAFAFEPSIRSPAFEARGKLRIIKAQANRDLQIGNLADRNTDRAFVMIGEPDILIEPVATGQFTAEVLGYDTYNPSTGNVEMGGAKDIDCWMLDSDYDGRSFYARYIHFPNKAGDKQIKRLKRTLGDSLNPYAWAAMQSYKSVPFKRPVSGRVAVRIITNTHTEMATVVECPKEERTD